MKMNRLRFGILALQICVSSCLALDALAAGSDWQASNISGPYNSGNLSVFFIHGKDQIKGHVYMTLQEALAKKEVVVHETGNVNELSVDNLSNSIVFIQSGDIVKGGRQDRTMNNDLLLQPRAKNFSLDAFCVEHGRWSERAGEAADSFNSSNYAVAGKDLKLAAQKAA